jgi:hypothetical protein
MAVASADLQFQGDEVEPTAYPYLTVKISYRESEPSCRLTTVEQRSQLKIGRDIHESKKSLEEVKKS